MALVKAFAALTALFFTAAFWFRVPNSSVPQPCRGRPRKMIEDTQAQAGDLVIGPQPSRFCWQLSVSFWAMAHFSHFCPWCPFFLGPRSAFGLCWVRVCELCWVPTFSPAWPRVSRGMNGQQDIRAPFSFTLNPLSDTAYNNRPQHEVDVLDRQRSWQKLRWLSSSTESIKMTLWNFKS